MTLKHLHIIVLLLFAVIAHSQKSHTEISDKSFDDFSFASAAEGYENLLRQGYDDSEIYRRLADANFYNSNYVLAAKWYRGLYLTKKGEVDPEITFRYALSLKSLGRYAESDEQMFQLRDTLPNDPRVKKFMAQPEYLENIEKTSNRSRVDTLNYNSEGSDFAPAFYKDDIVFASTRTEKLPEKIHGWTQMPFLDLYQTKNIDNEKLVVVPLDSVFNSEVHESSISFSNDGHTAYFTRNNFKEGEFVRDSLGVSRLKIYRAKFTEGKWQDVEDLPFNSDAYSTANPSLSPDGRTLYFVSDMPGSLGKSDIYYVSVNEDGTYGEPYNLGADINTNARETFPFIGRNGHLYFASDGHPGLGGLDIYCAKKSSDGSYKILNVGEPINSQNDDFALIFDASTKRGYFSSNREGGVGNDDIYSFEEFLPLNFDEDHK